MLRNGYVTFGVFNRIYKISDEAIRVWSKVMRAVTGVDPLTPERLAARKAAIVDLVSAALFETELYPPGANR